jgi:rare lipoprotein A
MRVSKYTVMAALLFASAALAHNGGALADTATWYKLCGKKTASGEPMDCGAMTAAHPYLPFGTLVWVKHKNGNTAVVRINDRLPSRGEGIDLTPAGADKLGMRQQGKANVTMRIISRPTSFKPHRNKKKHK